MEPSNIPVLDSDMVLHRALVVDTLNDAHGAPAEGVVRGRIGDTAGAQHEDILGRVAWLLYHVIQRTGIRAIECPSHTVSRDAGRPSLGVEIARSL